MANLIVGNDGSNTLQGTTGTDVIYGYDPNGPQSNASSILATRVASGLSQPLFAAAPPGDTGCLFLVEKTGQIKILDLVTGQVQATPFLDVSSQILTNGERGLLGLAFDPDYANNGFFYVYLINTNADAEVRRYHVSSNPNVADAASLTPIITIDQTTATNHKAGWIGFGPDSYLYIASGDGAAANNAQDLSSLLGKILRIDVHGDGFPADPTHNYAIPADNPFVTTAGAAGEIFALGLRNPWRDSFDRALGDFYIADVGANTWEEVNLGQSGANYGWPVFEGPDVLVGGTPTGGSAVPPIHFYNHTVGQSITGGYVYRGEAEALQGQYFFADFGQAKVFTLRFDGTSWVATDRTSQVTPDFGAINLPTSFGEDAVGNLYLTDFDGDVFRLTPMVASADQGDVLRGLAGNDLLYGGSGSDMLDGGTGADTMYGGFGADTYTVDDTGDLVVENAQLGHDTIRASVDYRLPANVEDLILLNSNGGAGSKGYGNALDNTITGTSGDDLLDGGGGGDVMIGGGGNDAYFVDNIADRMQESGGQLQGTDRVYAFANFRLPDSVEHLILKGSADLQGYGNNQNNLIYGDTGNDLLDGGAGGDGMLGGAGNDAYFVDNAGDAVSENANQGNDTVYASIHYRLPTNVDNLILIPQFGGNVDFQGYGNSLSNAIYGNTGNDLLNGDSGGDAMYGGAGNDVYFVDEAGDVVIENSGEGNDTVYASIDYRLTANVDNLILQEGGAVQAYGNNQVNALYGNAGNNLLNGEGGADAMFGGAGNDVYFVDDIGDVAIENANEGNDTVYASVDYTLAADVDNLVLQGSADLQGTGNGLANAIFGNSGNNLLTGNAGNDTFVFSAGQANGDTVVDFAGNGTAAGDSLQFVGFGTAAQGATFTQIGATNQWQIHSGLGGPDEIITLMNGASVDPSDVLFV
jgi:Ca2+-binding RTX toxin-like protein